jgi:hypothetical protein
MREKAISNAHFNNFYRDYYFLLRSSFYKIQMLFENVYGT